MGIGSTLGGSLGQMGGSSAGQALGGQVAGKLAASGISALSAMLFGRADPELAFQYSLEIDGITSVAFKECKGIEFEMDVKHVRSGGNNVHEHHLMGPTKFKPLEIKRGFMGANGEFYSWLQKISDPFSKTAIQRVTISLVIYNDEMNEVGRFNFYNAFVSKWSGPGMDAASTDIAFESMTIQYDWFEFLPGGIFASLASQALGAAAGALGF
jgi:phage tail-like protein